MYKVEHIAEAVLEARMNELGAEGWVLLTCHAHPFNTDGAAPIYVTVWKQ